MAARYNSEKTDYKRTIIKETVDTLNGKIEYDETKPYRFENNDEQITSSDLDEWRDWLLSYTKQSNGDDDESIVVIDQPEELSSNGPVESTTIADDVIEAPPPMPVVPVEELMRNDDALDVTPTMGQDVTFPIWGSIVRLDPGENPAIRAPPPDGIFMRIVNFVWRGLTSAARVIRCFFFRFLPK